MTEEVKNNTPDSPTGGRKWMKIFLISSASVLIVGLAVAAILLLGGANVSEDRIERVVEHNTVLFGVSFFGKPPGRRRHSSGCLRQGIPLPRLLPGGIEPEDLALPHRSEHEHQFSQEEEKGVFRGPRQRCRWSLG